MASLLSKDWRTLLESYLAAYFEDACRRVEVRLSGSEVRLLQEYGSERLRGRLQTDIEARRESVARSGVPIYEVIEQSEHKVIVQVKSRARWPLGLSVPVRTARIYLIGSETGWQMVDIFTACISCNNSANGDGPSPTSDVDRRGKCFVCRGTGKMRVLLRNGKCAFCGGTGRCRECANEELPGWYRVVTLDGLKTRSPTPWTNRLQ
jgi:hypothetical protein